MKKNIIMLSVLLLTWTVSADKFVHHYDSVEEMKNLFPTLKDTSAIFEQNTKASGGGSRKIEKDLYFNFIKPETQGVLTFWVDNDYHLIYDTHKWHQVNFILLRDEDGKKKKYICQFRHYREGWRVEIADTKYSYSAPILNALERGGWTRFDAVIPAGEGDRHVTFYIDGHEAFTTPRKYNSLAGFSTNYIPHIDEISFSPDPESFRPNPVQEILPDNPYGQVYLNPDEKLNVKLLLNPKGSKTTVGKLNVSLFDGRGRILVSDTVQIDWDNVDVKNFNLTLPTPPRSGYFWLEAKYQEKDRPADPTRRRINLQFLTPGFASKKQAPLELFRRFWDFIPVGKNESGYSAALSSVPTKDVLIAPAAPPTDWSIATPLRGEWAKLKGRFRVEFSCDAGWYRQVVNIPSDWQDEKFILDIRLPQTIATIYTNGKRVGKIELPGGVLDLTPYVAPGKKLDLAIFVAADPNAGYLKLARKVVGERYRLPSAWSTVKGLPDDVILYPEAKGARIEGVFVQTSVAKKELTCVFELSDLESGKHYQIKAAATSAGKIAQEFPKTEFTAKSSSQKVTITTSWKNPVLWELGRPWLYDLNAVLMDKSDNPIAYLWPERFGFREITNNGPDLTLNGRPITLFQIGGCIGHAPEWSRYCDKFGFNSFTFGFTSEDKRVLDEMGIAHMGKECPRVAEFRGPEDCAKYYLADNQEFWDGITRLLAYRKKTERNHPSFFFNHGVLEGQKSGHGGGLFNPFFQTGHWVNRNFENDLSERTLQAGQRIVDILHKLDPTRLVIAQDSACINDTINITEYAGFEPIQEFIERTEYWREHGTKPFLISEQASPMYPNWSSSIAATFHGTGSPSYAEWTAEIMGDKAYIRTELDEKYLKSQETKIANERQYVINTTQDKTKCADKLKKIRNSLCTLTHYKDRDDIPHNILWRERIKEQLLNWRSNNLGLISFYFSNGGPDLEKCFQEFQKPVTGFLAGTKEKPTLKTHIFIPGEILKRGAILLNNTHKVASLTCAWKLEINGKTISKNTKTETIPAGDKVFVPISVKLPDCKNDQTGKLTVDFIENGNTIRTDTCDIDVIVPEKFINKGRIALVDPEEDTYKVLKKAGIKFSSLYFNEDFSPYDTIIFGRNAFKYELNVLPKGLNLDALTKQGKRILIMEQDEKLLRDRFKLRTEYLSPRDVFGRIGDSAIIKNLPDRLLKYWRGSATLTDGYEVARNKKRPERREYANGGTWKYIWNDGEAHHRPMKWGNTHNVATVVIIKPDTGNFRTLIDCGFGSNYAAAWELENNTSRIVFSQLDVCGRTKTEPAAIRYLQNLVRHVQDASPPKLFQTVYLGGDKGAELLKSLDVTFKKIIQVSEADPQKNIIVIGDATRAELKNWKVKLAIFANAGGTVFCLPKSEADLAADWTPFKISTKKRVVNHTIVGKPTTPLLAGLGNSDFYWKGNMDVVGIVEAKGNTLLLDTGILTEVPYGKGRYIFCQVEPALFGDIEKDHWLKLSKHNTERMLRTLLSNAGAAMPKPRLLELPNATERLDKTFDLAGAWKICPAKPDEKNNPTNNNPDWHDIKIPGLPQKVLPKLFGRKGDFWLKRVVKLESSPARNERYVLFVGRISGSDVFTVNEHKTAYSNLETDVNSVSSIYREYEIPNKFLRKGENELLFFVSYDINGGLGMDGSTGEIMGPMELKRYKSRINQEIPETIELSSQTEWWWHPVKDASQPWNNKKRKRIKTPGVFQAHKPVYKHREKPVYFWYCREFNIPKKIPEGLSPTLIIGSIVDEDTVYFNGVKIGHTGKDTNPHDYWNVQRAYPIPHELIKVGQNTIQILVDYHWDIGGIDSKPVQIIFEDPEKTRKRKLEEKPYLRSVSHYDDPYWNHGF